MKNSNQFQKIVLALLMLLGITTHAQDFVWAKQMGGINYDQGYAITVDTAGNVYTTGNFIGTADFDPSAGIFNLTSAGNSDIFISKLDAAGNFLWAKQFGGIGSCSGKAIALDAAGNVYTIGTFEGIADFDPSAGIFNLTSAGNSDIFISKLDAAGNFLWAKQFGGIGQDMGRAIALDAAGNVYTTGDFIGTADFDPGTDTFNLTSAGSRDIFISKLDAAGNFLWAKQIRGINQDMGEAIALDTAGNIYTTGKFQGTADFDPSAGIFSLTPAGSADIFILKLNNLGNFLWAKQIGGIGSCSGEAITLDAAGNIYTTGYFETADFDPGTGTFNLTSVGHADIFILKLNNLGNFLWAKQIGGGNFNIGESVKVDVAGNVYTTGIFQETADFDPGTGTFNLISAGSSDVFILKLNSAGNFLWAKQIGGTSTDIGGVIALDAAENIYTIGYFFETADFDPGTDTFNLTSVGGCDIFISKLSNTPTGITESHITSLIKFYPNPTSGNLFVEMGADYTNVQVRVKNAIGQEIFTKKYASTNRIDLDITTAAGIYFIELSIATKRLAVLKVIKQ